MIVSAESIRFFLRYESMIPTSGRDGIVSKETKREKERSKNAPQAADKGLALTKCTKVLIDLF